MKSLLFLLACVLLLWTQTAFVNCQTGTETTIAVDELHDGIKLTCPDNYNFTSVGRTMFLTYKDENSGQYTCERNGEEDVSIYVKFRTCDNCIEIDTASIAGMAIGDVVATCVVGVAVYLFASVIRNAPVASNNKRSDRKLPAPRGASNSNDPYQALRFNSPKDEYDKLNTKR